MGKRLTQKDCDTWNATHPVGAGVRVIKDDDTIHVNRRTMTRDPRVDPRPGDVVKFISNLPRTVLRVGPTEVFYLVGTLGENSMPLKQWRRWARSATVLQRGPDE